MRFSLKRTVIDTLLCIALGALLLYSYKSIILAVGLPLFMISLAWIFYCLKRKGIDDNTLIFQQSMIFLNALFLLVLCFAFQAFSGLEKFYFILLVLISNIFIIYRYRKGKVPTPQDENRKQ